jgi:LPXTG-site transpeptidase (sortase) family protein
VAGFSMIGLGLLLLGAVGGYYAYTLYAHSKLDGLVETNSGPVSLPAEAAEEGFVAIASDVDGVSGDSKPGTDGTALDVPDARGTEDSISTLLAVYGEAQAGEWMHPKYWAEPMWAGSDLLVIVETQLPPDYMPPSVSELVPVERGRRSHAHTILIPLIGVDSEIKELEVLDLGDNRAYETPDNVVGHIPSTSNPGELGSGWFFGHLESPLMREGDVFARLPRIPDLLKAGDAVYVTLKSPDGDFLYQVTDTRKVHEDDLRLFDEDGSSIVLVSCVPRLVYDHRLLVIAKLIGVKSRAL